MSVPMEEEESCHQGWPRRKSKWRPGGHGAAAGGRARQGGAEAWSFQGRRGTRAKWRRRSVLVAGGRGLWVAGGAKGRLGGGGTTARGRLQHGRRGGACCRRQGRRWELGQIEVGDGGAWGWERGWVSVSFSLPPFFPVTNSAATSFPLPRSISYRE